MTNIFIPRIGIQDRVLPNFSSEHGTISDLLTLVEISGESVFVRGHFRLPPL